MHPNQGFFEILETVTVDCKDNGEHFTVTDKVAAIGGLLENSGYRLVACESLALLYARRELHEGDRLLLVSSHIDSLYGKCFCTDEGEYLRGTFDNSLSNAAVLECMLGGRLPENAVVAFTGDEEHSSQGAVQALLALGRMGCSVKSALVLDVTNEGWENGSLFTIENDSGIDILTAHRLVEILKTCGAGFAFRHQAEPDESWDYSEYGIPSLSLCVPVYGELHSDAGVLVRKNSVSAYCDALCSIVQVLVSARVE